MSALVTASPLVQVRQQIEANLRQLAAYLRSPNEAEREYAKDLVRRGICFVILRNGDDTLVGPSRFVGYPNNTLDAHRFNDDKDGRDSNKAITRILGQAPTQDPALEDVYREFCRQHGIHNYAQRDRRFWRM